MGTKFASRTGEHIPERVFQRFWERVDRDSPDSSCWPWKLSIGSHGYGQIGWATAPGKITMELAHRVAWISKYSYIPQGMTVDHKCHNRPCCNPSHLRLRTNIDNATDNGQGSKTHCPRGHEYAGDNLYISPIGHRRCRECARILNRKRRRR